MQGCLIKDLPLLEKGQSGTAGLREQDGGGAGNEPEQAGWPPDGIRLGRRMGD